LENGRKCEGIAEFIRLSVELSASIQALSKVKTESESQDSLPDLCCG
tara:strand:- start:119 stop:259 length:141 start_codon:yes stop_codon:yes gene_type:complete